MGMKKFFAWATAMAMAVVFSGCAAHTVTTSNLGIFAPKEGRYKVAFPKNINQAEKLRYRYVANLVASALESENSLLVLATQDAYDYVMVLSYGIDERIYAGSGGEIFLADLASHNLAGSARLPHLAAAASSSREVVVYPVYYPFFVETRIEQEAPRHRRFLQVALFSREAYAKNGEPLFVSTVASEGSGTDIDEVLPYLAKGFAKWAKSSGRGEFSIKKEDIEKIESLARRMELEVLEP